MRPHIVWFGENLDRNVLNTARNLFYFKYLVSIIFLGFSGELVENCEFCLVVGTSSVVYPAAMFAPLVAERGKPVAEFNITDEPAQDNFE